jgi:predicted nucleotidyltransferase component of viral defense system
MIDFEHIKKWFPEPLQQKNYARFILREYLQYLILDFLSNSKYARQLNFIGGTSLRLIHGIDRFSEDIDFDHKELDGATFIQMTDRIVRFLQKSGFTIRADDKEKDKTLKAYRRNLVFPGLLFEHQLSPFRDEKFLIKIESQDQEVDYTPEVRLLNGCGYIFNFQTPAPDVLCAMKISALLSRKKGRDFYDSMFVLSKTSPDYSFLEKSVGIRDEIMLKQRLLDLIMSINLKHKARDFEHLLISREQSNKILLFPDFIRSRFPG